jgi:GNAT superfamily N-acetyltransferase
MPVREITEFTPDHVRAAAAVLARRHRLHREHSANLPDITSFTEHVESALVEATGSVAIEGDEVVGYLLGRHATDDIGPHVWSHVAGHAADEAHVVQDLYTHAARRWIDQGLRRHFVFVPAVRSLVEPWFRLSFGASAALAARPAEAGPRWSAPGVAVRNVERRDYPAVARLERLLYTELLESPSFSGIHVDTVEEFEAQWLQGEEDDRYVRFCAELEGEVVGQLFLYRRPEGDLRVPPKSIDLASASTEPRSRGRGVATALTWTAIGWARDQGLETVITDWRMTNVRAARFWPRRGFDETFLRLYRSIP